VAEMVGLSAIAAFRAWDPAVDPQRFVVLVNRRQEQLEEARSKIAGGISEEAAASGELKINQAIGGACTMILSTPDGSSGDEIDQVAALLVRHFIHQLQPSLWNRDISAAEILAGLDSGAEGSAVSGQSQLDDLETALVGANLKAMGTDLSGLVRSLSEGEGVSGLLFTLGAIGPLPSPGHLAAAAARTQGGSVSELEPDARSLLDSLKSVRLGSEKVEIQDISSVFLLAMQMEAGAWKPSLRTEIQDLLEHVCTPLLRLDSGKGDALLGLLFISMARAADNWQPEELRQSLEWIGEFEESFEDSGISAPVLELTRAELAFRLAARDVNAYLIAHRAASAFAWRFEAEPSSFAHGAYGLNPLVDALRILAISETVGVRLDLMAASKEGAEWAKARLSGLAQEHEVGEEVRDRAARYLAEVELEERLSSAEFGEMLSLEWDEELLKTRSIGFLVGFLQADDRLAAAVDLARVRRASAAAIDQIEALGGIGAREGSYLPLLTEPWARARMGMGGAEALALGRAAAKALDARQADAAAIALGVVLNLTDTANDPTMDADFRELAEEVAERFLPAVLENPADHPVVPRFLVSISNRALNFGALRQEEVHRRLRASLAALLLAIAMDDGDGAAMAAYMSAELSRLVGHLKQAERWMAVYDAWRGRGALDHQRFERYREAIEWDRQQLQEALAAQRPAGLAANTNPELESRDGGDPSGRLSALATMLGKEPLRPLDDEDVAALKGAASAELSPVLLLHHWTLALAVCARASQSHPQGDLLMELTAAVGSELLTRELPAAVSLAATPPALEMLVEAAISVGDVALAGRALSRVAATFSALFLSTGLSSRFLSLRPTMGGRLRQAALRAFEQGDLKLALEIAETGRMKLLSSLASGGPRVAAAPALPQPRVGSFNVDRLVDVIRDPDAETIETMVRSELDERQLASVARTLVLPWVPLASTYKGRVSGGEISTEVWGRVLTEPSLGWLAGALGERQVLVYPFIDDHVIGAAVLAKGELFSFRQRIEDLPGGDLPGEDRPAIEVAFGGELKKAIFSHLDGEEADGGEWDVRVVAWDSGAEAAAQRIGTGFWLGPLLLGESPLVPVMMPTARLLEMERRASCSPPEVVSFLGDPSLNLVGPWIEGIAWSSCFGPALRSYLGKAATKEAALKALCESDLVVFSGHTFGETGGDDFGLGLADGVLTQADLLEVHGKVRASTAILSSCSAASVSRSVEAEVVGIVTALVGLGVRQILAPRVEIDDPAAAVFGARIATAVAAGGDLRQSLAEAGRDCLGSDPPEVSVTLPSDWVDLCPRRDELPTYADVTQRDLLALLREFSVFGGGR
jgi:CHAT domain